jgi:ATP synthase in type III secretion protein N
MQNFFANLHRALQHTRQLTPSARVLAASGTIIKASLTEAKIGELCRLTTPGSAAPLMAEVVALAGETALLTPIGDIAGIAADTRVTPLDRVLQVPVGPGLLGRILNGLGQPLDVGRKGPLSATAHYPIQADPPAPLDRRTIDTPIALGLRAIDGPLTCGEGQRMGLFGAAGCGKSVLMACLARNAQVDVSVLALIGERGREVQEFIQDVLGAEGLARSVVVVATSDRSAMERLKAAYTATAIAEYFRDQGKRVLLMLDSITRFARAQREIGLSAGEPPTRRGFPPSVFSILPRLLERSGMSAKGSITGIYTVLVEGDDMTEPVADEVRSILDGHIVLSRELAAANHYPAIDVLKSISRVMNVVTSAAHRRNASRMRDLLSKYKEVELLVRIGEYQQGNDPTTDEAIAKIDAIRDFLKQGIDEKARFEHTLTQLAKITAAGL